MSKNQIETACVLLRGPDVKMDQRGKFLDVTPINALPIKCPHCTFPDLDFVAKPYLLGKSISASTEITEAMSGNFFVTERVRHILDLAVPGACIFHSTTDANSKKSTPWWLAVPKQKLKALVPKAPPPFCPKCHEPREWPRHQGEVWERMSRYDSSGVDVFKTLDWQSGAKEDEFQPPPWTRSRFERDLYFSVRLEQLLNRAKVKGQLKRGFHFDEIKLSPEDEAWIEEKLKLLAKHGLMDMPKPVRKSSEIKSWFSQFLKRHAAKGIKAVDFAIVETKRNLTLPQDYKGFISKVGPKSFKNVEEMEETLTTVLPPHKLDFKNHRRGKLDFLVGDDAEVDGVVFAEMDNGDCFVFDVSVKDSDYPVFWFKHEENLLESFAPNFAECIKRFAQKN